MGVTSPNLRVFAGFDLLHHATFTQGSPSVQIDIRALQSALQDGLGFYRKGNDEIAIGVRPDHFLFYCQNSESLHRYGSEASILDLLTRIAEQEEITEEEVTNLSQDRERVVRAASRLSRLARFRLQVVNAYENRCAVTRWQLRLVEAAHILPVSAGSESIDDVRNGVALSPTYHRAFDRGLIYLSEDFEMRLNQEQSAEVRSMNLDGGLVDLEGSLGRIHLPHDRAQWPDHRFIRLANEYRRINVALA